MNMRYMPSIFAVMAAWLLAAPFLLGYADNESAVRNDVVVGAAMLIAAAFWGFRELKEHGWSFQMLKDHRRSRAT
jgi:hypothetical protein